MNNNILEKLILGRKGGNTSSKIIEKLYERPFNANQIAKKLEMHYNTIQYQIKILEENNIVVKEDKKYGPLIFLTPEMKKNKKKFKEIMKKNI